MSANSTIEWTDSTWNPSRGCSKISPGCKNCYAETFAERFRGVSGNAFENGFDLRLVPHKLADPLLIPTSQKIFVNSMSDLFHERVPSNFIRRAFRVMKYGNWHNYQILTKRPERMKMLMETKLLKYSRLPHIWLGVSVENKRHGLPRIDVLRNTPARVRFLSVEPLIEGLGIIDLTDIDWVIVGGESGPHHRPIQKEWVREIRDQCYEAGVPFFFKQWGGRFPKANGRTLDGRVHDEYPPLTHWPVPNKTERLRLVEKVISWYPAEIATKRLIDPAILAPRNNA